MRETFFANQVRAAGLDVKSPEQGDFVVEGKWLFEIGGRGKQLIGRIALGYFVKSAGNP